MSISRANGAGWGSGDEVTSTQINDMDTNATYALDKRAGQTDTLASVVTCSGAGRIVPTVVTGADANTTYTLAGGNSVIRLTNAITANRTYTLSATGAQTGDTVYIFAEPSFAYDLIVKDQSSSTTMFTVGNPSVSHTADGAWASFIYVGGWRLYQSGNASQLRIDTITATGTFTVRATKMIVMGTGGGGGGGAGVQDPTGGVDRYPSGGGGGGGACWGVHYITSGFNIGDAMSITIGAGGAGGAGSGADGSDGSSSLAGSLVFPGGQGGKGGGLSAATATHIYVPGGGPVANMMRNGAMSLASTDTVFPQGPPGQGGFGSSNQASAAFGKGNASMRGYAGGLGGAASADSGTYRGGGPGGGGGGGPFGAGGAGGVGGNGGSGGYGFAGTAGTSAAANTGAGGGGGGGGGNGYVSNGAHGVGGGGGSGLVTIISIK